MTLSDFKEPKIFQTEKKYFRWILLACWALTLVGLSVVVFLFSSIDKDDLPTFEQLENPTYDLASVVYDENSVPFGKYYIENRETVSYDELSPKLVGTLLATEDERFHGHSGIDFRALFRVGFKTVLMGDSDSGGGSTITQQLAKLLYNRPRLKGSKISRMFQLVQVKLKEWVTAVRLEKGYTKKEIVAMYLNKFEFINGAHGIKAAAETYFTKDQSELADEEIATLIGMLQNPSLYNPKRFPEKSKVRRNVVLSQMKRKGLIDSEHYDTISVKDIDMTSFKRETHSEGFAPYFRSELTKWLFDLLKKEEMIKPDGEEYNIYRDGLKIYTTIDLNYQRLAEEAVIEHMKWNQERYWKVWKRKDPWKFEADSLQLIIRKDALDRNIKNSDRYLSMRQSVLGSSIQKIRDRYENLPLSDNVIKSLINIDKSKNSWNSQVNAGKIKKERLDDYKNLLGKKGWNILRAQWDTLQLRYQKEFVDTKVKMKVFDYNEDFEKEVEMTPLDSVRYHGQHLQSGMLAADPFTGYIKAWVGGINHKYFKYDHINSRRQVGSTIKPFVYATAIGLQGISPCQQFEDIQYSIAPGDGNFDVNEQWSPANANETFTGNKYNLFQGLLYSKNSITVRLVKEMGNVEVIRELLDNAGISKSKRYPNGQLVVPNVPSICLGAMDLTLTEMTGAYTTFANNGMYTQPIFVKRIEDKNGKIIYNGIPEKKLAINPMYSSVLLEMLQNNVAGGFGLGTKTKVGGKTGTTNDYADGWFMAVTPELIVGTWVGGDDKWIRFLTLDDGQGFVMARPITEKFLKRLEKDTIIDFNTSAKFPSPPREFYELIDCDRYKQIKPEEERAETMREKIKLDEFDEDEFDDEFDDEELEEDFDDEFDEDELDEEVEETPTEASAKPVEIDSTGGG